MKSAGRSRDGVTRILVVEDEKEFAKLIGGMLRSHWPSAEVKLAYDGTHGIAKLLEMHPDLVITDVRMPGRSGHDLCELIRRHRDLAHAKIVVMTAYHSPHVNREAMRLGADAYLPKPFSASELKRVCARLIGEPLKAAP